MITLSVMIGCPVSARELCDCFWHNSMMGTSNSGAMPFPDLFTSHTFSIWTNCLLICVGRSHSKKFFCHWFQQPWSWSVLVQVKKSTVRINHELQLKYLLMNPTKQLSQICYGAVCIQNTSFWWKTYQTSNYTPAEYDTQSCISFPFRSIYLDCLSFLLHYTLRCNFDICPAKTLKVLNLIIECWHTKLLTQLRFVRHLMTSANISALKLLDYAFETW